MTPSIGITYAFLPMKYVPANGRRWLFEAWRRKTSVLGGALALVSLSLAHYAGFLMNVPLQIVAVAGIPLAKGVTATFLFYVFLCAVLARVLTSIFQLTLLPALAATDRLERGLPRKMDRSRQRRFVRSHSQTIKWEGYVWIGLQTSAFLLLMMALYIDFTITWLSGLGLIVSIAFIILSGLVRSGFFLQPKTSIFIRKIKTRSTRSGRAASAAFVTATAALVVIAFFMGSMRMTLLRKQDPQMTISEKFTGMANVVASAEGALLLFQKQGEAIRYIYSSPEFTTSVEPVNSKFPPIGIRNASP